MKVLWLTSWYPSQLSPYNGDFIQRHAKAVSLFNEVEVIHVVKDADGLVTSDIKEIIFVNDQLTERIIYYKPLKISVPLIDRIFSGLKYRKIYRQAVKKYILIKGKPALIHVHIAMKAGLTALWAKKYFGIPYILTEQWGGYFVVAKPNIRDFNKVYHYYWNRIFKEALATTFVSVALEKLIISKYKIRNTYVIPNVVNTEIFFPKPKKEINATRFIHISTMNYQKNVEAILEALNLVKEKISFELFLYGTINSTLLDLINHLGLQNNVFVMGEVPQVELARAIQQSDALILYSRYETFGCVLIEANACGIPVIISDLEVFHELVEEGINGMFARGENPVALAEKLKTFIVQKDIFDKMAIASTAAAKYNFNKVGKDFNDMYIRVFG